MTDTSETPLWAPRTPFFIDDDGDIADADGHLVCCPARDVWANDEAHALWVLRCFQDADRIAALEAEIERLRTVMRLAATTANGALDLTATEATLRRDLAAVRDELVAAYRATEERT